MLAEKYMWHILRSLAKLMRVFGLWLGEITKISPDKKASARIIFRVGELYQTRQRLKITASSRVIAACDEAYANLRSLRAVVSGGAETDSLDFLASNQAYRESVQVLQEEIRRELRIPDSRP
jgi:hypothetical protein